MFNRCKNCDMIIAKNFIYCKTCVNIEEDCKLEADNQIWELEYETKELVDEGQKRKANKIEKNLEVLKEQILREYEIDEDYLEELEED